MATSAFPLHSCSAESPKATHHFVLPLAPAAAPIKVDISWSTEPNPAPRPIKVLFINPEL